MSSSARVAAAARYDVEPLYRTVNAWRAEVNAGSTVGEQAIVSNGA